jgi:hypothetical protein
MLSLTWDNVYGRVASEILEAGTPFFFVDLHYTERWFPKPLITSALSLESWSGWFRWGTLGVGRGGDLGGGGVRGGKMAVMVVWWWWYGAGDGPRAGG